MTQKRVFNLVFCLLLIILSTSVCYASCCVGIGIKDTCNAYDYTDNYSCVQDGGKYYDGSCSSVPDCVSGCALCQTPLTKANSTNYGIKLIVCDNNNFITINTSVSPANCNVNIFHLNTASYFTFTGTVTNETSNPVLGANVSCGTTADSNLTDSSGHYTLNCMAGSQTIYAYKDTKTGYSQVDLKQNSQVVDVQIGAVSIQMIKVNVTDNKTGLPIDTATITVTAGTSTQQTTNKAISTFSNIPIGSITIKVTAPGYTPYVAVNDSKYQNFNVKLTLSPLIKVSGIIYNNSISQSTILNGATVSTTDKNGNTITATSGSDGTYSFTDIPAGEITLIGSYNGFDSKTVKITANSDSSNNLIVLTSSQATTTTNTCKVNITLHDKINNGADFENADVFLTNKTGTRYQSKADSKNIAEFLVTPDVDNYTISVDLNKYEPYRASVNLLPCNKNINVILTPYNSTHIAVKVEDATTYADISTAILTPTQSSKDFFDNKYTVPVSFSNSNPNVIITASASGYYPSYAKITINSTNYNANLMDLGTIIYLNPTTCSSPDSPILAAEANKGDVDLTWRTECEPNSFTVYLNNTDIQPPVPKITINDGKATTYTDKALPENTKNCYYVVGNYNIGSKLIEATSNTVCVNTSYSKCFSGNHVSFCRDDGSTKTLVECDNSQIKNETLCLDNEVCVETSSTEAQCAVKSNCTLCNRPFDLFAAHLSTNSLFGGKWFNDTIVIFASSMSQPRTCSEDLTCYIDYSRTSVDKYYSCDNVHSCYDFISQSSCTSNNCINGCEWISTNYSEFGIGVCRPKNETEQSCSKFNTRSSILNSVFNINKETCSLYSSLGCYYDGTDCVDKKDASCWTYGNNSNDCIGSGENATNVSVNVTYLSGIRKGFNNKILNRSNDYFNFGLCRFMNVSNVGCIKDADNNSYDDAPADNKDLDKYMIPPETSLLIHNSSRVNTININYTITDKDNYYSGMITHFSVTNESFKYPDLFITSSLGTSGKITFNPSLWKNQTVNLFYYSEDNSSNLEELKNISLYIDMNSPNITYDSVIVPDISNPDNPTVDYTALLGLDTSTGKKYAFCINNGSTGLFILNGSTWNSAKTNLVWPFAINDTEPTTNWTEEYAAIPTSTTTAGKVTQGVKAKYNWYCIDDAGNTVSGSTSFTLDALGIFSGVQPNTSISIRDKNNVNISIKTLYDGECNYTYDGQSIPFRSTEPVDSNLHYKHSDTITMIPDSGETEYEHIPVTCNLNGVGLIDASPTNDIYLTLDDKAPTTRFILNNSKTETDITDDMPADNIIWVSPTGNVLKLKCEDAVQGSNLGDYYAYYPPEIGCKAISIGTSAGTTLNPSTITVSYDLSSAEISSIDNYDNVEAAKTITVKSDSNAPNVEIFTITTETNQPYIDISGNITKTTSGAPIKDAQFEVYDHTGRISNNSNSTGIGEFTVRVPLIINDLNIVRIFATDEAGNIGEKYITVLQDSTGPNITAATIQRKKGINTYNYGTQAFSNIEYGDNLILKITNLNDICNNCGGSKAARVSSVVVKDIFGIEYPLSNSSLGTWSGTIYTSYLPVMTNATFTIIATDSVGNTATKDLIFNITDTTPPNATLSIENKYGDLRAGLIKGENYIIMNSSEPLFNASLYAIVNNTQYNIKFTARDFNAMIWVGMLNITQNYTTSVTPLLTASINGTFCDLNGLCSNDTTLSNKIQKMLPPISELVPIPSISVYDSSTGTYNVAALKPYNLLLSKYNYTFTVNGRILDAFAPSSSSIELCNGTTNDVTIRIENSSNYEIFRQKVYVDSSELQSSCPNINPSTTLTPGIDASTLNYSQNVMLINGTLTTKEKLINISGNITDTSFSIYVIGEDGMKYNDTNIDITSNTFLVKNIRMVGNTFEERPNNLLLVFENTTSNKIATQPIKIVKDLNPPFLVKLSFNT